MSMQNEFSVGDCSFDLTLIERLYVKCALFAYGKQLVRDRNKRSPGSEIYKLLEQDVEAVSKLWARF